MRKNVFSSMLVLALVLGVSSSALAANDNAGSRDGSGQTGSVMNQEEAQTQNQGEENLIQVQNQEKEQVKAGKGEKVSEMGVQRRSKVANAVQEMLQVADRNGGIGQQVREIAQNQNQEFEGAENSLARAQERSKFAKFFIGPNYTKIYEAEGKMEKVQERIEELNQLKIQASNEGDQQLLEQHIQALEQVKTELQNQLQEEKKGFSLLGWLFRAFAK